MTSLRLCVCVAGGGGGGGGAGTVDLAILSARPATAGRSFQAENGPKRQ